MTRRHGSHWRHGPHGPPWWPEGERWPPAGPPWGAAGRRFRHRFLISACLFLLMLVGVGIVIGRIADRFGDSERTSDERRSPIGLVFVVGGVGVVGGVATALAYRRISRPIGDLLGAAERVAAGDYEVTVRPDGPRDLRHFTSTFNDMAGRLAATDEQRRRFLADVTHELRTPLAVLQSGIEAQLDGIHPRDDRHLGSLLEETQRLGRLVDDLHTVALAEAGRIVLHREQVAVAALVEEAIAGHAALAGRKGVTLRTSLAAGLPELDVDPTRIRQVLDNLLSNAVRHTPSGSEVHVEVAADTGRARITVTDSGPGFPPQGIDSVFDRFRRPTDSSGSGLGLSIVRDLVEAHGGTVSARNEPTGGASVSLTLPLNDG